MVQHLIELTTEQAMRLVNPNQNKKTLNEWCLSISSQLLPHLIGRLYIDKLFNKESMNDMRSLVNDLKQAFRKLLNANNYSDSKTRANAISKLKTIAFEIASPHSTFNHNELQIYSNDVRLRTSQVWSS